MSRFTDKTVIVTGAAGALGTSMVRSFVAEGACVVAGARRQDRIADLLAELGDRAVVEVVGRRRRMSRHPAPTFVFADLVGYTRLTDAEGDEAAARLAGEFQRAMRVLSRDHGARQVKSMGDGS